jgi:RHS repeat-associated protein
MLPAAEERIPALTTSEEIFSLAVLFAACASQHRIGATAVRGEKTHQRIFSRNRTIAVGATWAKWPGTHQVSRREGARTALGIALDANGNTLSDPSGKSYSWDFENRLTQAVVPGTGGGTTTFKYDPFGRRIYKSSPNFTGIFVYDNDNLIETVNASGAVLASYTQTRNTDEPLAELRSGGASFYEADGLGSITSLSSSAGLIANTYTYDSFGNVTNFTGTLSNPFRYTAREFDSETSLYYNRARYYDPTAGRFISQDPSGYKAGMNVYRYARNNPALFVDPSGLCEINFKIKLWSSDEITIGTPASDWELIPHQENADGILPINNLWCHWSREYNTTIRTTTTYLVEEICDGVRCGEYAPVVTHYLEKETTSRPGTTTKTWDSGTFTLTGFDSDFLEELYCNKHRPPE